MYAKLFFSLFLLLFPVAVVIGQEDGPAAPSIPGNVPETALTGTAPEPDAKLVGGMSILGNKEAPMSLFIVPWKSSELGAETSLTRTLDERPVPVDREVFAREIAFYQAGFGQAENRPAAVSQLIK